MQVGCLDVVRNDQKVDIRVAVGIASGHGPEEPGTMEVGPRGELLSQTPDQLTPQTRQSNYRPSRKVVPVQQYHRRSAGQSLAHESAMDELLDDGTRVTWRNASDSGKLPPSDRLFESSQRLKQRAAHGGGDVKHW